MPKYYNNNNQSQRPGKAVSPRNTNRVPLIVEPRCKVCASPHRHLIDQMLANAYSHSEIERQFAFAQIPRRSISKHAERHLSYEEAGIREIVEREAAAARKNHDLGKTRIVTKTGYLEVALQKAFDALISNSEPIPAKDAVKVIEQLDKLQAAHQGEALDELRVQFQMFMQSVKELVERDKWDSIVGRTADLLRATGRTVEWENDDKEQTPAEAIAQITEEAEPVEAVVVE